MLLEPPGRSRLFLRTPVLTLVNLLISFLCLKLNHLNFTLICLLFYWIHYTFISIDMILKYNCLASFNRNNWVDFLLLQKGELWLQQRLLHSVGRCLFSHQISVGLVPQMCLEDGYLEPLPFPRQVGKLILLRPSLLCVDN